MLMKIDRLEREKRTILVMIEIFCRGNHGSVGDMCSDCQQLYDFALQRIDKCLYLEDKPSCAKCPTHCYKPAMRERIREVMRYSGPRMILSQPWLTIWHYIDEISKGNAVKVIEKK
jgi:hypothetical protein